MIFSASTGREFDTFNHWSAPSPVRVDALQFISVVFSIVQDSVSESHCERVHAAFADSAKKDADRHKAAPKTEFLTKKRMTDSFKKDTFIRTAYTKRLNKR